MNAETWMKTLLADHSDGALSMWADWLEDQSDAACEGVRWLVESERAQLLRVGTFSFMWKKGELPREVFKRLTLSNDRWEWKNLRCYDIKDVNGTWTRAEAHYFALLDAGRAYAAAIAAKRAKQAEASSS